MTYCKQIPLPILNINCDKIKFIYNNGNNLFIERQSLNPYWKSFDIVNNFELSPICKNLNEITSWFKLVKTHTGITKIKHCYISILEANTSIPWHRDSDKEDFNKSIITSIQTDKSFIEFGDTKYKYRNGYSYLIRSGTEHRVINLNDDLRITLCTTPEENPYV